MSLHPSLLFKTHSDVTSSRKPSSSLQILSDRYSVSPSSCPFCKLLLLQLYPFNEFLFPTRQQRQGQYFVTISQHLVWCSGTEVSFASARSTGFDDFLSEHTMNKSGKRGTSELERQRGEQGQIFWIEARTRTKRKDQKGFFCRRSRGKLGHSIGILGRNL